MKYFVKPTGSDNAAGTQAAPWKTLSKAASTAAPGDTVVLDGVFSENLVLAKPGLPQAPITFMALTQHSAKVIGSSSTSAVLIEAPYVRVRGLDVTQTTTEHGIEGTAAAHHIEVSDNLIHDCGGGGIEMVGGDYYTIEGNEITRCCALNGWQTSGISIWEPKNEDSSAGWHNVLRYNYCHDNMEGPTITGNHTDGNGIILDDFNWTQNPGVPYTGATLVENNLCTGNGGPGIQIAWSQNVTARFNTCGFNNRDLANNGTWRSELNNAFSNNNNLSSNLLVCDSSVNPHNDCLGDKTASGITMGVVITRCLTWDVNKPGDHSFSQENSGAILKDLFLGVDPKVSLISMVPAPNSPVIGAGTPTGFPTDDFLRKPRSNPPDIGAIQHITSMAQEFALLDAAHNRFKAFVGGRTWT